MQVYRKYLAWKFRKRRQNEIEWNQRMAITWKNEIIIICHPRFCQRGIYATEVIFRYFNCQLTVTRVINLPNLFLFDIVAVKDKKFNISFGREKIKNVLFTVCECSDDDLMKVLGS